MRTETNTIEIYKFDELSYDVQSKVIETWRYDDHFYFGEEWQATLKEFQKLFDFVNVKNWRVDYYSGYISASIDDEKIDYSYSDEQPLQGVRLWKWLVNNNYHVIDQYSKLVEKDQYKKASYGRIITRTTKPLLVSDYENCPLSGVCCDYNILEPLAKFLKKPDVNHTIESLFIECLEAWVDGYQKEFEYWKLILQMH